MQVISSLEYKTAHSPERMPLEHIVLHPSASFVRFGSQAPPVAKSSLTWGQTFQKYREIASARSINFWTAWVLAPSFRLFCRLKNLTKKLPAQSPQTYGKLLEELQTKSLQAPEPVKYKAFSRPSTGIAKATSSQAASKELFQEHEKPKFNNKLMSYGVYWDAKRIVRDILQNFYDGEGQTLDGVSVNISDVSHSYGQKTIKITGNATYDAEYLIYDGASSKYKNDITAGGFGEGAKTAVLCLLRDYPSIEKVIFRSSYWQAEFTKQKTDGAHDEKEGVFLKLSVLAHPIQGNEFEITTSSTTLIEKFKEGKNLFYHSQNPDFKKPTYDCEVGGFKLLPLQKNGSQTPGHAYEAGQQRDNELGKSNLSGINIWSYKKLDMLDRDRTTTEAFKVLKAVVQKMSTEEAKQLLVALKPAWYTGHSTASDDVAYLLELVCEKLKTEKSAVSGLPAGLVAFPKNKNIFYTLFYDSIKQIAQPQLVQNGYHLVDSSLYGVPGVHNATSVWQMLPAQKTVTPSRAEQKKIELIQALIKHFASNFEELSSGERRSLNRVNYFEYVVLEPDKKNNSPLFKQPPLAIDWTNNKVMLSRDINSLSFDALIGTLVRDVSLNPERSTQLILRDLSVLEQYEKQWIEASKLGATA